MGFLFMVLMVFFLLVKDGAFDRATRLMKRDRHFDALAAPRTFEKEFESFVDQYPAWNDESVFLVWKHHENSARFQDCGPVLREQAHGTCFVVAPALCQYYHAVLHSMGHCPDHLDASAFMWQHLSVLELIWYVARDDGYRSEDVFRQLTREMTFPMHMDGRTPENFAEVMVNQMQQYGEIFNFKLPFSRSLKLTLTSIRALRVPSWTHTSLTSQIIRVHMGWWWSDTGSRAETNK
jgi:hypothetical protein